MKNVFGILYNSKTKDKAADYDGACFIEKQIQSDGQDAINDINIQQELQQKKMSLPLPLSIIRLIAGFVAMITVVGILRADVTISEAFANAPWAFYSAAISGIVFGVLQVYEILKKKKHTKSEEFKEFVNESEEAVRMAKEQLGIPSSAPMLDVFVYVYKYKKGKDVPVSGFAKYNTVECYLYQNESKIFLADITMVLGFNKCDFVKIEKITKKVTSQGWNKEQAINSEKYKRFKLTQNQYGTVFFKYHYSLQITHDGAIYEILIPPYEVALIAKLLDLPYEE